jgi:hypothetical protein
MKKLLIICTSLLILSCGSNDGGDLQDGISNGDHRIFVTSNLFNGNLGGLAGADAYCLSAAQSSGLSRTYKAILSGSGTNESADDRLNITGAVYIFSSSEDRVLVVGSGTDIWGTDSQSLLAAVSINEAYNVVAGGAVWTGTDSDGKLYPGSHCLNWASSSAGQNGWFGTSNLVNAAWIENNFSACSSTGRLYCISVN